MENENVREVLSRLIEKPERGESAQSVSKTKRSGVGSALVPLGTLPKNKEQASQVRGVPDSEGVSNSLLDALDAALRKFEFGLLLCEVNLLSLELDLLLSLQQPSATEQSKALKKIDTMAKFEAALRGRPH